MDDEGNDDGDKDVTKVKKLKQSTLIVGSTPPTDTVTDQNFTAVEPFVPPSDDDDVDDHDSDAADERELNTPLFARAPQFISDDKCAVLRAAICEQFFMQMYLQM